MKRIASGSRHKKKGLKGKSICLVEDDFLFAQDMARVLEHEGAKVFGPFPSEATALAACRSGQSIDCAILDIRLMDGVRFGVAAHLLEQRTPFLFLTAVNRALIPPQFSRIQVFTKPVDLGLVILAAASFFAAKPI